MTARGLTGGAERLSGPETVDSWRWATVVSASTTDPLQIRLDGDSAPLLITPDSLVNREALKNGDRVWMQMHGRRLVVVGRTGGAGTVPPGVVMQWAGTDTTVPAGWLLCNGATVSRTTYAALFSAIGTTYGIGDGSTTFTLPDFRTRVLVGYTSSDADFNALGKLGGAKTHTLTVAEMPVHRHKIYARVDRYQGTGAPVREPTGQSGATDDIAETHDAGGGAAHNNLQPYAVINHIIKA